MMIRSVATALALPVIAVLTTSVVDAQPKPPTTIGVYVVTMSKPGGSIDQKDREESLNHLRMALGKELPKFAKLATVGENADVTVEVLGRKADQQHYVLYLLV